MTVANIISIVAACETIDIKRAKSLINGGVRYFKGCNQDLSGTWDGTQEELNNILNAEVVLISPVGDVLNILIDY